MEKPLTYEQVRGIVEDGDIVFFYGGKGLVQKIIRWVTGSKITHVGIAFWITSRSGRRLLMVERQGGTKRRIINLSFYDGRIMRVFKAPKRWAEVEEVALCRVGIEKYNFLQAIYVGIHDYFLRKFNIRLPKIDLRSEICSEFVGRVYGIPNPAISPGALFKIVSDTMKEKTV